MEKVEEELKNSIKNFDVQQLRPVNTQEKIVLPTVEGLSFNIPRDLVFGGTKSSL